MLLTVKNTAIAAITAFSMAATTAAPAMAWGEREQDFLKGAAAAVIVGTIINEVKRDKRRAQPQYAPQAPVYYEEPAPRPHYQPRPSHQTSIYRTPAARAFGSYSLQERRAIQRSLAREGYYYGNIDGSFGPGTYRAIADYAADTRMTDNLRSTAGAYGIYDGLIF